MKQKNTPEHILEMLQELKKLFDEKKFDLQKFTLKYASYPAFRKNLVLKGIIKKEFGRYKWITIEPNIIMAKELIKLYLADSRQRREEFENSKKEFYKNKSNQNQQKELELLQEIEKTTFLKGKNTAMSLAKQIRQEGENWNDAISRASKIMKGGKSKLIQTRPLTMEENYPIAYAQDFDTLKIKYEQLQEELKQTRQSLTNQEIANKCFKQQKEEERKLQAIQNKISIETPTQKELNLESIIKEKDAEIKRKENENKSYKQKLKEAERGIDDNVQSLMLRVRYLRDALQEKNDEIKDLQNKLKVYKAREIMSKPEPSIPEPFFEYPSMPEPPIFEKELTSQEKIGTPASKTYKLFGIPVFSINNK